MGPEAAVGAFSQFATVFMIVGLFMGGAIRRGRILALAVAAVAAALGIAVAMVAPMAKAGIFVGAAALVVIGPFAAMGKFIRTRFDAHGKDKAV